MGQESIDIDRTAKYRLANLAAVAAVWLGWTVYSLLKPLVDMVPQELGQPFVGVGITFVLIALLAALFYRSTRIAILMVTVGVLGLTIGVVVVSNLQSSLSTSGLTQQQGQALVNTFSTSFGAYSLLPIFLIVVAAVFVIYLLMSFTTGTYLSSE